MSKPAVSVVIPTFNAEAFLPITLQSVLQQTVKDVEIIVVDDGSTDQTLSIARSHGDSVRVIEQRNSGVCVARNRGLAEAAAPRVCFLDHDDYWFPDKLERQLRAFSADHDPGLGLVFSAFIRWNPGQDGSFPDPSAFELDFGPDELDPDFSGWIYHQLLLDCHVLTSTAMIDADALRAIGGFDPALPYAEDWDLWLRLARERRFAMLRRPTTLYRQHRSQGSRAIRPIDYRTRLLTDAVARWGLSSPDGTELPRDEFTERLAAYHTSYGLDRLKAGQRRLAFHSFYESIRLQPSRPKPVAYMVAGALGWRPPW